METFPEGSNRCARPARLTALHFQFAPWMAFHPENFAHIEACQAQLPGYQLAVEFRNKSWFEGKHQELTLAFERERGLANVTVDEPQGFANCIPAVWEITTPELAIVRLHGRNHATWNQKGLESSAYRFNYDYTTGELTELAQRIQETAQHVKELDVVLNNNYEDQGQRNARELMGLIGA